MKSLNSINIIYYDKKFNRNQLYKSLYYNKSITKIDYSNVSLIFLKDIDKILKLLKYNHHILEIKYNNDIIQQNILTKDIWKKCIKLQRLLNFNKKLCNDF